MQRDAMQPGSWRSATLREYMLMSLILGCMTSDELTLLGRACSSFFLTVCQLRETKPSRAKRDPNDASVKARAVCCRSLYDLACCVRSQLCCAPPFCAMSLLYGIGSGFPPQL